MSPSDPRPRDTGQRHRRRIVAALGVGLLTHAAGCATAPARSPDLPAFDGEPFRLTGRFAMTHSERAPEEKNSSASGRFVVARDAAGLTMELSSPLGQTVAQASQAPGRPAELKLQDGRVLRAATLDDVFERAIGIRVPAGRLPDWLAGHFEQVRERNADGSRVRAVDSGWQIERRDNRWDIVRDEGPRRIEVRLVADVD